MDFVNDPVKAKRAFLITLTLTILFFLSTCILGFLYWQKANQYNQLISQTSSTTITSSTSVTTTPCNTSLLTKQISALEKDKTDLQKKITDSDAKFAKIKAYNEFFKYINSVIETHNGFSGWTDAEYQIARGKAQTIGDNSFLSTVDWAWNQTSVDVLTRLLGVWKAITSGIDSVL